MRRKGWVISHSLPAGHWRRRGASGRHPARFSDRPRQRRGRWRSGPLPAPGARCCSWRRRGATLVPLRGSASRPRHPRPSSARARRIGGPRVGPFGPWWLCAVHKEDRRWKPCRPAERPRGGARPAGRDRSPSGEPKWAGSGLRPFRDRRRSPGRADIACIRTASPSSPARPICPAAAMPSTFSRFLNNGRTEPETRRIARSARAVRPPSPERRPAVAPDRFPGWAGYTIYPAPVISPRDEEGFSSCSACPCHRAVASTPPRW